MVEKIKADLYLTYLERILAGENDIGPVEDIEIDKLLELAKIMLAADLNINSETMDKLRQQILDRVSRNNISSFTGQPETDDELDDEALDHVVAAGFTGQGGEQMESCPYCGSRARKFAGKCPVCSR